MFTRQTADGYTDPLPGIRQKTLVFGDRTLMTEFRLAKDSRLPSHGHPYEQTGYLVSGQLRLRVGESEIDATPGDSWCIPANAVHGATALADSVVIEVFSPVRQDYLPSSARSPETSARSA